MTIFDYLINNCDGDFYKDEYGNVYLENIPEAELLSRAIWVDINTYMITKELCEKYSEIEIIITDDESVYDIQNVRRPYYRMRGVPVTREQAFDIIRRTDNFFHYEIDAIRYHDDFIGGINFDNWLIMKNHYPDGYGWIHADGTVGGNAITQTYPDIKEFVLEWFSKLVVFPYLNLVIAVTYWDELPPDVIFDKNERALFKTAAYDEKFYDAVLLGIYVHDKKVEILNRQDTIAKYKEYNGRYGYPREKFEPEYYMDNKITQIDLSYLKRCIESYGLDADTELGKVREYIWKGKGC